MATAAIVRLTLEEPDSHADRAVVEGAELVNK